MFDLTDRVAIITGAASGIGAATARVFAQAGADVALAYYPPVTRTTSSPFARPSSEPGAGPSSRQVDVRRHRPRSTRSWSSACRSWGGSTSPSRTPASPARCRSSSSTTTPGTPRSMSTSTGVWRVFPSGACRHAHGRLRAADRHLLGRRDRLGVARASALRGGQSRDRGACPVLAVDYGPGGITANAVAPGVIRDAAGARPVNSLGPDGVAAVAPKVPLGRVGQHRRISRIFTASLRATSQST